MKLTIKREQFFCLRNWALCSSLRAVLTVRYADTSQVSCDLELSGIVAVPDGMLLAMPETDGVGLLCITADPAWGGSPVTEFSLYFETSGRPLSALHLEYAAADAETAYRYHEIPWEKMPLLQPEIRFRRQGELLIAEVSIPETQKPAAEPTSEQLDLAGDIHADLRILRCFSGSDAAKLAAGFERLLTETEQSDTVQQLAAQEEILTRFLDRTLSELRQYQNE